MHEDRRRPGWYPDPRLGGRFRYWDGAEWHRVTTSEPVWGAVEAGDVTAPPRAARAARLVLAVVVAVAMVVAAVWLIGGSDRDGTGATTSVAPERSEAASADDVDPTATDGSVGAADPAPLDPAPTDPAAAPSGPATPAPTAPAPPPACTVPATDLLQALRTYAPLASLSSELTVTTPRCAGDWATAVVAAPSTDSALAVFRAADAGWTVVMVGSAEPCSGLGIPGEHQAPLGCDFG